MMGVSGLSACNHRSAENDSIAVINEKDNEKKDLNEDKVKDDANDSVSGTVYNTFLPTATPVQELKIVAVGDILLGRGVGMRLKNGNKDYTYPFLEVRDILKKGDVIFCNLEEPITSSTHSLTGIKEGGKYVLKNDVESIEGLNMPDLI